MLAVVILVFPSTVEVSAEVTGGAISDGVYQITNVYVEGAYGSYDTFYLRNENGSVKLSTCAYGDAVDNLYSYWYFEHQGGNEYLIRNMGDYSKTLSVSGSDAVLTSSFSPSLWNLSASANYGDSYQLLCASNTDSDLLSVTSTPEGQVHSNFPSYYYYTVDVCVGSVANMAIDSWNLIPAASSFDRLCFQKTSSGKIYDTFNKTYHIDSSSATLASMGYTVKAISSANGITTPSSITWSSSNSSVATVNSSGKVTFANGGQTTITATAMVNGVQKSASYTLEIKVLYDGTYFLRNIESGLYADMEGTTVSSGVPIEKWTFDGSDSEKWNFTHLGANVYTITLGSHSSYYMGVASGAVNSEPGIVLYTGTVTDRMKWKVERGNAGYKIVSYLNSGYVLAVKTAENDPGENLILGDWVDNTSYKDEWVIGDVANYAHITNAARIYYDTACTKTPQELSQIYQAAAAGFLNEFHIRFNLTGVYYSSNLDLSSACHTTTLNSICNNECAPEANCNTTHHRSAYRLTDLLTSNSYYTYRLVGYAVCSYKNGSHNEIVGAGDLNGKDSATSMLSTPSLVTSIQHELTHNLGGDHDCTPGQDCVLNGGILNRWCDACRTAIKNNY